jgi:hypothetical protein
MLTKPHPRVEAEIAPPESGVAGLTPKQIREHLDTVMASDGFASSRRASELLSHLVERALAGDTASLKERLLGVEIFHRRSDYDTSTDSIVRVTANDVRRRLAQFYARYPDHILRISLPLGSYVPDFIASVSPPALSEAFAHSSSTDVAATHPTSPRDSLQVPLSAPHAQPILIKAPAAREPRGIRLSVYAVSLLVAMACGWSLHGFVRTHYQQADPNYAFYGDLLGPIGLSSSEKTEIAVTNPHVLLYHGLTTPGPALGESLKDIPVPPEMAAVLNKTANDQQADFPYHHFFVDSSNYTGLGEAKAAVGLARVLQATGRNAQLTEERFLNWETARQNQLVILGAPHESNFVQETLSAANFTIGYDAIHNAHPQPGELADYVRSHNGNVLEDYGLIWMTQSPSGTRILVLAGLSSAGTAGVGEFFSDPERMRPVYRQLRAAAGSGSFPDSWQVLLRIEARQDVPVSVTPVAVRTTPSAQR